MSIQKKPLGRPANRSVVKLARDNARVIQPNELSEANTPALDTIGVKAFIANSLALYNKGQIRAALDVVIQGLKLDPENAVLLNHLGVFAAKLGDAAAAETAYRRAIAADPGCAENYFNLGNLLRAQKRPVEAESAYRSAVAAKPDFADAYSNLGNLLREQNRPDEAEAAYRTAIESRPDSADTYSNLGNLLREKKCLDGAEAAYRQAIAKRPDYAEAHSNLGLLLKEQKRTAEAEAAYRQAIALKPGYAEGLSNLGVLLMEQKRHDEAEAAFRRAIALRPGHADAYANLGNLLQLLERPGEAETAYRKALAAKPDSADARWNLSLLLLKQGRFMEGWPEHEARFSPLRSNRKMAPPPTSLDGGTILPQWQGEPLSGRSLLIWSEQGLGDEIQFVRYLNLFRTRGLKQLMLACKPPLKSLFASQNLADRVISTSEWRPEMAEKFDFWCYPLSLPLQFSTTLENLPATIPYVRAEPARVQRWATRLPQSAFRVGLVWKGSPTHANDANRSLPSLASLAPLWSVPGIAFVSLQKGAGEDEAGIDLTHQALTHLGSDIDDFADSAAILSQLDLMICVDTAVAHLAGALGKPCWVLLPKYGTDWRWLEGRTDSPWYPQVMRLFRQSVDGNWDGVVSQLVEALKVLN